MSGTSRPSLSAEGGSQAVEFAMVLPLVVVVLALVLHAALLGADLVAAQGLAREAARAAAVGDDASVREALRRAAGSRQVRVDLRPPGGSRAPGQLVTADLQLRSRAFAVHRVTVWLPARATMRVEDT